MITREHIRELAQFQLDGPEDCALSFYFQPRPPQNKSHREEAILAKDLVRDAMREAEENGKNGGARADLDRILDVAGNLHGNQARAKAIFACGSRNVWREFDLPPLLTATQLFVNRRFHLRPLAVLLGAHPRLCLTLVDAHKARFFDLRLDEMKEHEGLFRTSPHYSRSDGFGGYDAGHIQHRASDQALHHFKSVAEHLKQALEKGSFDNLIIGCHDNHWHQLEPQLHSYVKKHLLGRFSADVGKMTNAQVHERASRILQDSQEQRQRQLVQEVLSQAKSNSRGVTGLRRVLRSLEQGEVQTLLIGDNYTRAAVECTGCGRLDSHMVRYCPTCGGSTRGIADVCDAIIPAAILRDIELFYVKDDPEFDQAGNIAALLRFRADQTTGNRMAAAS